MNQVKPRPQQLREQCALVSGKTEHPANSNHIFVWVALIRWKLAAAFFNGQPYCAAGCMWLLRKLGIPLPEITNRYYVPSIVQWARATGRIIPVADAKLGDWLVFAFTATAQRAKLGEHIETVVRDVAGGGPAHTFGFNTSSGTAGSQDNGGGCFPRTRPLDATVIYAIRMSDFYADTPAKPVKRRIRANPFGKGLRGYKGRPIRLGDGGIAVEAIQWAVGVPVDGVFGSETDHAVRLFQRYHTDDAGNGLIPDGEVGRLTAREILKVAHPAHR